MNILERFASEKSQEVYIAGVNQAYIEVNELNVASGRNLLS